MSALTERIGHYHRAWSIESTDAEDPGIECRCIDSPERMDWTTYAEHIAEVTEAAVRAAVAAEIKAATIQFDNSGCTPGMDCLLSEAHDKGLRVAARIAEGK